MRRTFFALGLLLTGCQEDGPALTSVPSPAGPGSGEPSLAAGADGSVYLTWIEAVEQGHALRFSRWEGESWGEARTIASGENWFVNWADFPSLVALEGGTLAAHWLQRTGEGYAYEVRVALSADGGATWSDPVVPHTDGTPTEHGFVSLFPYDRDTLGLVWLDGREMAGGEEGHGGEKHGNGDADTEDHGAGAMTLRFATLDREGRLGNEALLDARVCDCCQTDALRLATGATLAVYRDRSAEEVRDISVIRMESGAWSDPVTLHADDWKIDGCPVNGPRLDASGDRVVVVWFTVEGDDQGIVNAAFSKNGGRTFGAPVRMDDGDPAGRVDVVLLTDGSALVAWLEERPDGSAEIRLRSVSENGVRGQAVVVATTSPERASGLPRMARMGDAVFLAWTERGEPDRVATAVYR